MSTCLAFIPQGILLVYDITNGWSFDGIDRWIREIDEVMPFNPFVVDKKNTGNVFRSSQERPLFYPLVQLRMRDVE